METLGEQETAWDRWLGEARVGQGAGREAHTEARAQAVLEELARLPTPRTILDVGCGDGYDSVLFSRYGQVVATDLAPTTIADASRRYGDSGVRFVAGDFLKMELPGAPYQTIVTLETVAHVYDQMAFFRRCAELLGPGGVIIVTTQNKEIYDFQGYPPPRGWLRKWVTAPELRGLMSPYFRSVATRTIVPAVPGTMRSAADGRRPPLPLRVAYSHKLDRIAGKVGLGRLAGALRCSLGYGQTIVAAGVKR
jgi:ubiquinone/menaquinone biosynthesis C-methylase UbiE